MKFVFDGAVNPDGTLALQKGDKTIHPLGRILMDMGATNVLISGNFVSVALAEPEDWGERMEQIRKSLRSYFKAGGEDSKSDDSQKIGIVGYQEGENDAAVRRFVLTEPLPNPEFRSFLSDDEDGFTPPMAKALFRIGATRVDFEDNTITITVFSERAWEFFMDDTRGTIIEHLNMPLESEEDEKKETFADQIDKEAFPALEKSEKLAIIEKLFDELVRPALANDGGGLDIQDLEGNLLKIKYQGSCGTCPSSITGTLRAIDRCLKGYLDENMEVASVS